MNQDSLINILSMGDHGVYVWIVIIVLFTILGSTIILLNRKIRQAKKEINEEDRKKRLFGVLLIIGSSCLGIGLILYALNSNLDYFLTPSELKQSNENVVLSANTRVKLGGMVKKDSFFINENKVNFEVTDFEDSIKVIYEGLLPDLFKEGKGIVVLGKYIDGIFYADEVFAKHDENYMPVSYTHLTLPTTVRV